MIERIEMGCGEIRSHDGCPRVDNLEGKVFDDQSESEFTLSLLPDSRPDFLTRGISLES
jgi:hypothetical protein